jgi:hypothetical protein
VGRYVTSSDAFDPFAELWNGTTWTLLTVPTPSGATDAYLLGVSCFSKTACMAVGSSSAGTLAEQWNGSVWTIDPTPNPSGIFPGEAGFDGVSCPTSSFCEAVGLDDQTNELNGVVAETWDGTSWSLQSIPDPSGSTELRSVSCVAATACEAVGESSDASSEIVPFGEHWNGLEWSIDVIPNPSGGTQSFLYGVSCSSSLACTAVGFESSPSAPLVERWNGTAWSIETAHVAGPNTFFFAAACVSSNSCFAVGQHSTSGADLSFVEHWNGSKWSVQATPNPTGQTSNTFYGLSCPTTQICVAVGVSMNTTNLGSTLAERRT